MGLIFGILVRIFFGWLFIVKLPDWLQATGALATIIKVIGVLIIISIIFLFLNN